MKYIVAIAILISVVACEQLVPIPETENGFRSGNQNSKLHIEAFYDLACPDSRNHYFLFQKLFGSFAHYPFRFTVHHFPLPYHQYAFLLHKGAQNVYEQLDNEGLEEYIDLIFKHQEEFGGPATEDLKTKDVKLKLFLLAQKHFGQRLDVEQFLNALNGPGMEVRTNWKYGCSRGIPGTPVLLANGVIIDGADSWNEDKWLSFLKNYL
eukprot:TRINITY_DN2397_c0_g1_i3.p1 TRINITY_DN2397_c0_g1~~TRINITY_DN2397_c0_g1_i3.p1  ORF type:complete len:208 (+),score=30.93 TRINITY_DN2397_c0_g1_i3:118-741(+)